MAQISKVLQNLEKVQEQERENIYLLHKQNLKKLNESLTQLYTNRLDTISEDTNEIKWIIIGAIIFLTIGGMMGYGLAKYLNRNKIYMPRGLQATQNKDKIAIEWNNEIMSYDKDTKTIYIKRGE